MGTWRCPYSIPPAPGHMTMGPDAMKNSCCWVCGGCLSSGDDGLGNYYIRDDVELACSQAWPAWPASSPYITSIGATQLTDKYLPVCGQPYSTGLAADSGIPPTAENLFQCTGTRETVCSAASGGVITSGGGFSDVNDRSSTVCIYFIRL